jgi:ABC-type transporter Mla subunit MlaD
LDSAVARWPELRQTLTRSAALLKMTQRQLDQALEHREEYEAALQQTVVLAEAFAEMLPWFTENLDRQLAQQEATLDDLGRSIDEVGDTLPVYAQTASRLTGTARLLLGLVAAIVGLHGGYLILSVRLGRPFSV